MPLSSAGAPIPEDQRKKMEGKRSWKEQTVRGFSLDLDGFSSDEDDTAQPPAASLKHQSGPQASTSATGNLTCLYSLMSSSWNTSIEEE